MRLQSWWRQHKGQVLSFTVVTLLGTFLYEHEPHGWLRALGLGAISYLIYTVFSWLAD